jgi:hypothetical protein
MRTDTVPAARRGQPPGRLAFFEINILFSYSEYQYLYLYNFET